MQKLFVGPQLRHLRRANGETQAQMARRLGISPAYVNLLESNQRSLSAQVLVAITEAYGVDWKDLLGGSEERRIPELRAAMRDPIFNGDPPDLQELRAALDHAPQVIDRFMQLHKNYQTLADRINRLSDEGQAQSLLAVTPETAIHDFFRDHGNHFPSLEALAEAQRAQIDETTDELYSGLKRRLRQYYGVDTRIARRGDMPENLRVFDRKAGTVILSEALDHANRVFQLAHVLGILCADQSVSDLVERSGLPDEDGRTRLSVELTNYFAAALLMPYDTILTEAERSRYDLDELIATFGVSFEQLCHRLTTLQRDGKRGVPFFFLRVDRAGNVTKRFNATPFVLAEQGGSCPVWNIHGAFQTPGVILTQFVEVPDGGRFLTLSRTSDRPAFDRHAQDRRLIVALGCERLHADRICYADGLNLSDPKLFAPIGINCQLCPRQVCLQRAHQPLNMRLKVHSDRRGTTRYES